MATHATGADRLVICFSDIEIGSGGVLDDFPHTEWLGQLLLAYNRPPFADLAVDVVFNGDTLDLLKTPVDGEYPVVVDAQTALAKIDRILEAHPDFPVSIRRFLEHPGAPRCLHFIVGNHDYELVFPEVQERLRQAIGHEAVTFPGFSVDFGDLHVEHGSQDDTMFAVDPERPLIEHEGRAVLRQPWGAQAVIEVALPMHHLMYDLDRLKPRGRALELMPDVRDWIVGKFWDYYTGDWIRGLVGGKPTQPVSWQMVREVAWRFRTSDPNVVTGQTHRQLVRDGAYKCVVTGHLHSTEWWTWADRKWLQTGCFRDEYTIDETGTVVARIPKTYAEVYLRDNHVVRSHLVEVDGPAPPPGHAPASVFDILPRVRPLMEPRPPESRPPEVEDPKP